MLPPDVNNTNAPLKPDPETIGIAFGEEVQEV